MHLLKPALLLPVLAISQACASHTFERAAYDALYQWQCLRDTRVVRDCDPAHPSYDQYRELRDKELKRD